MSKIDTSINLLNADLVSFGDDTKSLLDDSMKYNKFSEFPCSKTGDKVSYTYDCLSCPASGNCRSFKKRDNNLEIIEFLLDLSYLD